MRIETRDISNDKYLEKNISEIINDYRNGATLKSIAEKFGVNDHYLSQWLVYHHGDTYRQIRIARAAVACEKVNYITDRCLDFLSERINYAIERGIRFDDDGAVREVITPEVNKLFTQASKNTQWRAEREASEYYASRQKIEHEHSAAKGLQDVLDSIEGKERKKSKAKLSRIK